MNEEKNINDQLLENYYEVMVPNYAPANFVVKKAIGSSVWDVNDKKYIDFGGGIAVNSLGHSHPELLNALEEQAKKIWHHSNYLASEPSINLAKALVDLTFAEKVFFSNSGSEANETAIKIARKYHHSKGNAKVEIIAFKNAFHGRSLLNISLGGSKLHKEGFGPLDQSILRAEFNDLDSVKKCISDKTAAIIIEPIQGEAGVHAADQEFLIRLREVCDQQEILLIFDEVQSGIGRTGKLFSYIKYEVIPDILTSAKGLGGGMPIGATLTKNKFAEALTVGSHGSTFGGNPLACAVAIRVLDLVKQDSFLDAVKAKEELLKQGLEEISNKHQAFSQIRSNGLWFGCDLNQKDKVNALLDLCYEEGLIGISAGTSTLRFAPALNIPDSDIQEGLFRLDKALKRF